MTSDAVMRLDLPAAIELGKPKNMCMCFEGLVTRGVAGLEKGFGLGACRRVPILAPAQS